MVTQSEAFGRLPPRIAVKIRRDENGCWLWTGQCLKGHGRVWWKGKKRYAHRVVYEIVVGPIPDGLTLDHFRLNPAVALPCDRARVNPAHVEPVTATVNKMRGNSPRAQHARATHCPKGHPYEGAYLYVRKDGRGRMCRECHRIGEAARQTRIRGAI